MRAFIVVPLLLSASCADDAKHADPPKLVLDVDVVGSGSVISAPDAIDCGTKCSAEFAKGTAVTLQARAADGFVFEKWQGDCAAATGEIVDLILDANKECAVSFVTAPDPIADPDEEHAFTLVVLGPGNVDTLDAEGAVASSCSDATCVATFAADTVLTLAAHALGGSELIGFEGDCEITEQGPTSGSATVTMDVDRTCTVSFFSPADVTYPLRAQVTGPGRITSMPSGIDCDESGGDGCERRYPHGTQVTLTAEAGPNGTFVEWGHDCAGVVGPGVLLDMQYGASCSATFAGQLVVSVIGQGHVTSPQNAAMNCAYTCHYSTSDQPMNLVAVPDDGYAFVEWTGDCTGVDVNTTLPASADACTARFERVPPTITVVIDGAGGSVSSADGAIDCPSTACSAEIEHEPEILPDPGTWTCASFLNGNNTGCQCGCGTLDPDCASSGSSACLLSGDCESRDHIVEDRNWLCYAEPFGGVATVTLTATPDSGFVFSQWSGGCSGTTPTVEVSLPTSVTCTATFLPE